MKFEGIKKVLEGKFIHRYDVTYRTEDGEEKVYEMISRKAEISSQQELCSSSPDAVVLIMFDEAGERILIDREFRLATGEWVYNFPAGLIDAGETPEESARRELWEETGLELFQVEDCIPISYSAVGFSNETNVCIVGRARGEFRKSTSSVEEIEPGWYTKSQVRDLIARHPFAARTQAFCYVWSRER